MILLPLEAFTNDSIHMHPGLRVSTQNLKETAVPLSDYLAMAQHYLLDFQNDGTVGRHLDLETVPTLTSFEGNPTSFVAFWTWSV